MAPLEYTLTITFPAGSSTKSVDCRYTGSGLTKAPANASGIVSDWPPPVSIVSRGNAYAATKSALEAHTVNLAAELRGTGVTVNAYRPGGVDTAMQAWIRRQDPERIGAGLHERFNRNYADGALITPEYSAAALLALLAGDDTGAIWDVSTAPARA
jgi:NAD(P)-dependent dehydrogenase (short-subunit alcohol dehydrogenase family)